MAGLLAACALAACSPSRPDIVLVTIDTLRSDHLASYGYPRVTSPFLDELAAAGTLFERAYTACSHTTPAHASLFFSQYPPQHGMLTNKHRLTRPRSSLPTALQQVGYRTAAFPATLFLAEGLRPLFEHTATVSDARGAEETLALALHWLETDGRGAPRFLWLHFFEVHEWGSGRLSLPGDPLPRLMVDASSDEIRALALARGADPGWVDERRDAFDRYDARIAGLDALLREFHQAASSRLRDPVWVVTSDHGEGLGEHGHTGHGRYIYEEQLRIPLIVHAPGRLDPGRVAAPVSLVDVAPTLLAFAGAAGGPSMVGRRLDRDAASERLLYASRRPAGIEQGGRFVRDRNWLPGSVFAVLDGSRKYLVRTAGRDAWFDLEEDPQEARGNQGDAPEALAEMAREYHDALLASGEGASARVATDESLLEHLRALGYVAE